MKIGVFGHGEKSGMNSKNVEAARIIGREIARTGNTLVTGAGNGLPYEAVKAAAEAQGEVIGFSPAKDENDHRHNFDDPVDGFTEINYTGRGIKGRNVMSVEDIDAGIFINGKIGTLNEFTIAYDEGKNIGVLEGSGGISQMFPEIIKVCDKSSKSKIIYESDPMKLVEKIIKL